MELIRQKLIYSIFVLKNISWIPFDIIQVIIMFAYPKMSVSSGNFFNCLLLDNDVYSWGLNNFGQLGLGEDYDRIIVSPQKIPNLFKIEQISCGFNHAVAMTKSGEIYSWGYNSLWSVRIRGLSK